MIVDRFGKQAINQATTALSNGLGQSFCSRVAGLFEIRFAAVFGR
jgi:hypothetical protein